MRWLVLLGLLLFLFYDSSAQPQAHHNLKFDTLTKRWDDGMPLGNGVLGALIWQKNDKLRISLDRVDLWDDRPMPEIDRLTFKWVAQKVRLNQYDSVQRIGDEPYEKYPAPTKLPGAALEFALNKLGKVVSNELQINQGLVTIRFDQGTVFNHYIDATATVGYFGFEKLSQKIAPELIIPDYVSGAAGTSGNSVEGQSLERLGYKKGNIVRTTHSISYHQPSGHHTYYEVLVQWFDLPGHNMIGQWTISQNKKASLKTPNFNKKEPTNWPAHLAWWQDYWAKSSIKLPDPLLEKQYYLEMYKFACVARAHTPPISLQAIWTADNGNLPPWKGDYHHDLNTQLSYWPGYTGNHLDLTSGYTSWLWKTKAVHKKWTKNYFDVPGLNVPGVTTISGQPMGGWIQYSMSATTSAWLAQHFYWQWKYSMDEGFYLTRFKPYSQEVTLFIRQLLNKSAYPDQYIISSSPEYHDNSVQAWFKSWTNYELALMRHQIKLELLSLQHKNVGSQDIDMIKALEKTIPDFDQNATGLTIAPGHNADASHRHLSPYMAIHPLGLLTIQDSSDASLIRRSLRWLEAKGTRQWTGYSFYWAACMYARALEGDQALAMLTKFTTNFCSINSFHLNGDQRGGQYSDFVYRPFTLEGNFAFAQGIHELLIQSHLHYIQVFPAIPTSWRDVSFQSLRTEGAFLVSASKENGVPVRVSITSEAGGILRIKLPFRTWIVDGIDDNVIEHHSDHIEMKTIKGQIITFNNGYE